MSILRGAKKLILGVGLASCGAAAAGLIIWNDERIARASSLLSDRNQFLDWAKAGFPSSPNGPSLVERSQKSWDFNWDKRDPGSLVKPLKGQFRDEKEENTYNEKLERAKATATRNLILIRHGQYNLKGETDSDRKLTALGREQARLTGLRLKDLGLPYTRVIESTMTRAQETSQIIREHLPSVPVTKCDFLREGAPFPPDPPVGHWRPEARQFHEDGARIEAAFRKYFHRAPPDQTKDSYELLICHANVIRYFVCRALQFPPEAWLRFSLHNCSMTWIAIRPSGRVAVYSVGDAGHIPPSKMTTT